MVSDGDGEGGGQERFPVGFSNPTQQIKRKKEKKRKEKKRVILLMTKAD